MANAKNIPSQNQKIAVARSRILWEITAMLVVVMVASGLAVFFTVRSSQERLIKNSMNELLTENADNIASFFFFTMSQKMTEFMELVQNEGVANIASAILEKRLSQSQKSISAYLDELARTNPMGVNLHMILVISTPDFSLPKPIIFASNDESLIYGWEVPEDVVESLIAGEPYVYRKEGIPELGLQGEQLIITRKTEDPENGYISGYVGIKPYAEEVSAVSAFYDHERRRLLSTLVSVVGLSILAVIFVSFFVLSQLIRKRITKPVERLAESAARVMEGDLDVEIQVEGGGDFAILEHAFKEMLESIKKTFMVAMREE